jgi:hypothetical protein
MAAILGMFQQGLVLAAGLVLGRGDSVDDIPMLVYSKDVYFLLGRMQGGEFIVRTNSSTEIDSGEARTAFEAVGRRFEPCRARHLFNDLARQKQHTSVK